MMRRRRAIEIECSRDYLRGDNGCEEFRAFCGYDSDDANAQNSLEY